LKRQPLRATGNADAAGSPVGDWMLTSFPIITPRTNASTALRLLYEHDALAIPVCEGGRFVGLVDEQALLRCTPSELAGLNFRETPDLLARLTVSECWPQSLAIAVSPAAPVEEAASAMVRHATGTVAVIRDERPLGLVTWPVVMNAIVPASRRRTQALSAASGARADSGGDLCTEAVRDRMIASFPTVSPYTTVEEAIWILNARCTHVLAVCEQGRFLGFVDEKRLLRLTPSAATLHSVPEIRHLLASVPIGRMFLRPVSSVHPESSLDSAASAMARNSEEVAPVMDDDLLVGLLSWEQVLAAAAGETPRCGVPERRKWLFWM
jgi:CBS domain-containing protein